MESDATGFVLAGGRSTRMGADKSLISLHGQPLAALAVGKLEAAGLPVFIAGGQAALAAFAPVVADRDLGQGPLSGICAALASTSGRWAVFLPVDMPLLPASLVACLLRHAVISGMAVTIPTINGFAQTFPAVLDRATLPILERELQSGRRGCFSAFQAAAHALGQATSMIPVEVLVQCGQAAHPLDLPATRWFLNVNTAQELERAGVHAGKLIA